MAFLQVWLGFSVYTWVVYNVLQSMWFLDKANRQRIHDFYMHAFSCIKQIWLRWLVIVLVYAVAIVWTFLCTLIVWPKTLYHLVADIASPSNEVDDLLEEYEEEAEEA